MSDNETLQRLRAFTEGCRDDMHEPDEQNVDAEFGPQFYYSNGPHKVSLDNAFTNEPDIFKGFMSDMGFWLLREKEDGKTYREWFNLADIIALARRAQF